MLMKEQNEYWEQRLAALWARADMLPDDELVNAADALAAELPTDDPRAAFERACARDSTGQEREAEHFYRVALATQKLDAYRYARATIQLASTLRNLNKLAESERLLKALLLQQEALPDKQRMLHDEACAFLALTYAAQGRDKQAAGLALSTLAPHLTRYKRSLANYASDLLNI